MHLHINFLFFFFFRQICKSFLVIGLLAPLIVWQRWTAPTSDWKAFAEKRFCPVAMLEYYCNFEGMLHRFSHKGLFYCWCGGSALGFHGLEALRVSEREAAEVPWLFWLESDCGEPCVLNNVIYRNVFNRMKGLKAWCLRSLWILHIMSVYLLVPTYVQISLQKEQRPTALTTEGSTLWPRSSFPFASSIWIDSAIYTRNSRESRGF